MQVVVGSQRGAPNSRGVRKGFLEEVVPEQSLRGRVGIRQVTGGGRGFWGEVSAEEKELKALGVEPGCQQEMRWGGWSSPHSPRVPACAQGPSSSLRLICVTQEARGYGLLIWWSPGLGVAIHPLQMSPALLCPLLRVWGTRMG